MRQEHYAVMAVLMVLAGCSGGDRRDNAAVDNQTGAPSAAGAAAQSASAVQPRLTPGQWEMTVETGAMAGPGMPPELVRAMKNMKVTDLSCVTPEQANRPPADMFGGKGQGDCTYREFSVAGGKLHSAVECTGKGGGQGRVRVTTDGQFGGEAIDVRSRIEATEHGRAITMESHVTGRRTGECTGKEG